MNSRYASRAVPTLLGAVLVLLFGGCFGRPLKDGVEDWKPECVGGPLEVRSLPPAWALRLDYNRWVEADGGSKKARLYEAILQGATNQINFHLELVRPDTALGRPWHTFVRFVYRDPTNGFYELHWSQLGKHKAEFLRASERPRKVWLVPFGFLEGSGIPQLSIVAIEGVEVRHVLTAMPDVPPGLRLE